MAARSIWRGQIRLALVSIPIELFPATRSGAQIQFHQVHEPTGKRIKYEKVVPGVGWFDDDYLGIDQGPIIAMIENYRTDLIWREMRQQPSIILGLRRAGPACSRLLQRPRFRRTAWFALWRRCAQGAAQRLRTH